MVHKHDRHLSHIKRSSYKTPSSLSSSKNPVLGFGIPGTHCRPILLELDDFGRDGFSDEANQKSYDWLVQFKLL